MTWPVHLQHTEAGLALTFAAPISRLDMAPDVAAHLASLLAVEARHRMRGVVAELALPGPRSVWAPALLRLRHVLGRRRP